MRSGALGDGARLAAGTLTVLRVPAPRLVDRAAAAVAMTLAPVAGALLAVPAAAVGALAVRAGAGDLVAAGLALTLLVATTGGLHLDGLADTVDGLAAGRGDRARALEVMRRGDVGPLGAAALVLALLLQATALARALPGWGTRGAPAGGRGGPVRAAGAVHPGSPRSPHRRPWSRGRRGGAEDARRAGPGGRRRRRPARGGGCGSG